MKAASFTGRAESGRPACRRRLWPDMAKPARPMPGRAAHSAPCPAPQPVPPGNAPEPGHPSRREKPPQHRQERLPRVASCPARPLAQGRPHAAAESAPCRRLRQAREERCGRGRRRIPRQTGDDAFAKLPPPSDQAEAQHSAPRHRSSRRVGGRRRNSADGPGHPGSSGVRHPAGHRDWSPAASG